MLPVSKQKEAIRAQVSTKLSPGPRKQRSQNQYRKGVLTNSLKHRSSRKSHPAEPKDAVIPSETKLSRNPLQNAIGWSIQWQERKTAKAEIRKGNTVTQSRLTIDTEPDTVLRIRRRKEGPAA